MSYLLALGPFHPAWRGPQRIILRLEGEHVADLEYRDAYNERGCAERLARLDLPQALHLVTRICGTCSFAHSLAFCTALEDLCNIAVPERAAYGRCIIAELERLISHLQASSRLFESLGMEQRATVLVTLRESAVQMLKTLSGVRVIPDLCLPGGLHRDIEDHDRETFIAALPKLSHALYRFIDGVFDHRALFNRTVGVGVLPRSAAEQFGVRGPLARATGITHDVRVDHPYAAYEQLTYQLITQENGDVYARLIVLLFEAFESTKLIEQALQGLPEGAWQGAFPEELPRGQGKGAVEGPRGMLRYTVESDSRRITRVRIDTPRQLDRLLARTLLSGALVDDVVAIVASCDPCIACAER